ncbi:MAG: DUF1430 domain-containing protein [Peptococcaceae bacterium]|nr:DUF1430 domain-containing protein [Peptococcaceae bacterium]
MRKTIIVVMFVAEALIVFGILFLAESSLRYNEFINAERLDDSHRVILSIDEQNTSIIYEALCSLSDQYQANIIAARMKIEEGRNRYIKYVYITRPEFYQAFIFEGDVAHINHDSNQYLSTMKTKDPEQVGRLAGFARDDIFEVRSLQEMLNIAKPFNGAYTVQIDNKEFEAFRTDFYVRTGSVMQETKMIRDSSGFEVMFFPMLLVVIVCIHLIVLLVVVYDFAKDAKSIAIEKMLGHRESSIWGRRIFRLIRNQALAVIAVFTLMSLIFLGATNTFAVIFSLKLILVGGIIVISTVILSLVTFISIAHTSIVNMLKNLRPLGSISAFNMMAKIALMIIAIFLGQNALADYNSIQGIHAYRFAQWQEARDLYILEVHMINVGEWMIEENIAKRVELYFAFNKNGSILADFEEVTPEYKTVNSHMPNIKYDGARVNPNYLKSFPIYDIDGNVVQVPEDIENRVLLVPEGLKAEETEIREHYKASLIYHDDTYTTPTGLKLRDQEINIIWVKDGQEHFSYNLSINPDEGNTISDIIIEVITDKNGFIRYYDVVMSYKGNPLKIKPVSGDPQSEILEMVMEKGFGDNVEAVVSIFDNIAQEVEESLRMIGFILIAIIILLLTLSMIIVQSVHNYFDKNKRLISIRTFMGQSFRLKYGPYIVKNIAVAWGIIFVMSSLIASTGAIKLGFSLMVMEVLASFLTILVIEKKRILDTLKGGT